uniref:Response regulator receiver protein n=2 Tax=unclassified Mycobacterium TaxID=2642494 RepID=A0A5Q5BH53_MYCSS
MPSVEASTGEESATSIEPHHRWSRSAPAPAPAAAGRIRVLVVEPRRIYATMLARHLHAGDFTVEVRHSYDGAVSDLRDLDPDVVVVCAGPHEVGLALVDRIRHVSRAAVVALDDTVLSSLLANADPGHSPEADMLGRRIRHALRRYGAADAIDAGGGGSRAVQRREIADLVIDLAAHRVYQRGTVIALTRLEFAILAALSESPGEPLTCRHLQAILWGTSHAGGRSALGVHVSNLRRKLGDDPVLPRYVRTVRGLGYCLVG